MVTVRLPEFVAKRWRTPVEREVAAAALEATRAAEAVAARVPIRFRAAVRAPGRSEPTLLRSGLLTPYTLETIAADVYRAGAGARLEVQVGEDATEERLAAVRRRLAWLAGRAVSVQVERAA